MSLISVRQHIDLIKTKFPTMKECDILECQNLHRLFQSEDYEQQRRLQKQFFEINKHINISPEPLEELTERWDIPIDWLKNCRIYTCNVDKSHNLDMIVFPLFWMYCRPLTDFNIKKADKRFITMNGAYSYTREVLLRFLKEKNLLKEGYYSLWNNIGSGPQRTYSLPSEKTSNHHFAVKHTLPIEWYKSVYEFQIETCGINGDPFYCITEKTFRPLLSGKPFLNFGYPGMYKLLKSFGFKFDGDLSFDEDVYKRFEKYLSEVTKQINKDPNMDLVLHNKKVARDLYKNFKERNYKFISQFEDFTDRNYFNKEMIDFLQ